MEAKHTPGPWTISGTPGTTMFVEGPDGPVLRIRGGMLPVDADARLIAAAPDLLAALRMVDTAFAMHFLGAGCPEIPMDLNNAWSDVLDAIAKATGGGS